MSYGPKQTLQQGYEKFVVKNPEGCWDWKGCAPTNPGYGQFRFEMKHERAHRASWILHNGEIPEGKHVLHSCDNRLCSRPDHLFLGNQTTNMIDKTKKGRVPKGENHYKSKLTLETVKKIREMIALGKKGREIAKLFNIDYRQVSSIKTYRSWRIS